MVGMLEGHVRLPGPSDARDARGHGADALPAASGRAGAFAAHSAAALAGRCAGGECAVPATRVQALLREAGGRRHAGWNSLSEKSSGSTFEYRFEALNLDREPVERPPFRTFPTGCGSPRSQVDDNGMRAGSARSQENGTTPLPMPFCNTCFTRGGGWLNECNAENQVSLIRAYAPLGLKALLTDAGWFEGGWPSGAGNWNPRKDAYPEGMGPVAAAAKAEGMIYGLWFEPERVVAGTTVHREHPDWCLAAHDGPNGTYLLNFGLPEVQAYFFDIVRGFMELPGFRVYRQDFNMDPLPYWRYSDAPDRQGMTEMKYIEGLYAYWDRIRATWPDAFMEECASGGHRIDLETVMRMHAHQKTDYWFDNDVDHAALWSVSQYLPNNTIVAHLIRLDDYSFDSTMASSLCLGWIADAPDFDAKRGKELLDQYNGLRHLLVGAWYPLLPYTRDPEKWVAMQFHRPDLDEGMILAFRHAQSPYRTVEVRLHGLKAEQSYELTWVESGKKESVEGARLMGGWELAIAERPGSELVTYRPQ
ncbi:MAG: alpha-galactosidase [Armatimonadetes bacterium]|nr:alpha-galactosidase [Armatimonadota bacterium]